MKPNHTSPLVLVCALALLLPAAAVAIDADKKMDRLDRNDDGRISRSEHAARAERNFEKIDKNNDSKVTLAELKDWRDDDNDNDKDTKRDSKGRSGKHRIERDFDDDQTPAEKFKVLDANSDDRVTKSEYAAAAKKRFSEIDKNNDGTISGSELE